MEKEEELLSFSSAREKKVLEDFVNEKKRRASPQSAKRVAADKKYGRARHAAGPVPGPARFAGITVRVTVTGLDPTVTMVATSVIARYSGGRHVRPGRVTRVTGRRGKDSERLFEDA
eukprot:139269-Hanusia_phi.AAC.1